MKTLIIIRGAPGSGKSTLANEISMQGLNMIPIIEADQFFVKDGVYKYNPALIGRAHEDCMDRTIKALHEKSSVIVSNTFVKAWEIEKYLKLTETFEGLKIVVIHCHGMFKNIHNVPEEKVMLMRSQSLSQSQMKAKFSETYPNVDWVNYELNEKKAV